jgi:hypothetical protein
LDTGAAGGGRSLVNGDANLSLDPVGVASEAVGSLSVLVAGLGGGGTIDAGGLGGNIVACEAGTVLAGKGEELIALRALRDGDAVLVGPLLDLAVGPGVQESVAEALLGISGGLGGGCVGSLEVQGSDTGVAADRGDELVTRRGLGCGNTTLVQPSLELGVGPSLVEPITGVGSGLRELVGGSLVVIADRCEKSVALAGLRNGDTMLVRERLKLRVRPTSDVS